MSFVIQLLIQALYILSLFYIFSFYFDYLIFLTSDLIANSQQTLNFTKMKSTKRWWLILALLVIAALLGIFIPSGAGEQDYSNLVPGDTAWMLTATAMVLLMTPGIGLFLWWYDAIPKYYFNNAAKFYCNGHCKCTLGSSRF